MQAVSTLCQERIISGIKDKKQDSSDSLHESIKTVFQTTLEQRSRKNFKASLENGIKNKEEGVTRELLQTIPLDEIEGITSELLKTSSYFAFLFSVSQKESPSIADQILKSLFFFLLEKKLNKSAFHLIFKTQQEGRDLLLQPFFTKLIVQDNIEEALKIIKGVDNENLKHGLIFGFLCLLIENDFIQQAKSLLKSIEIFTFQEFLEVSESTLDLFALGASSLDEEEMFDRLDSLKRYKKIEKDLLFSIEFMRKTSVDKFEPFFKDLFKEEEREIILIVIQKVSIKKGCFQIVEGLLEVVECYSVIQILTLTLCIYCLGKVSEEKIADLLKKTFGEKEFDKVMSELIGSIPIKEQQLELAKFLTDGVRDSTIYLIHLIN